MSETDYMRKRTGLIVAALNELTGATYRIDDTYESSWCTMVLGPNPDEALLLNFSGSYAGKLTIKGILPTHPDIVQTKPLTMIGVSLGREASAIATDIYRRLLPKYHPILTDMRIRVGQAQALRNAQRSAAEELARMVEGTVMPGNNHVSVRFVTDEGASAHVEVMLGGSCTFTVHGGSMSLVRTLALTAARLSEFA